MVVSGYSLRDVRLTRGLAFFRADRYGWQHSEPGLVIATSTDCYRADE